VTSQAHERADVVQQRRDLEEEAGPSVEPVLGVELVKEILQSFLSASFIPEPRFRRRLEKLLQLEQQGIGKIQT